MLAHRVWPASFIVFLIQVVILLQKKWKVIMFSILFRIKSVAYRSTIAVEVARAS